MKLEQLKKLKNQCEQEGEDPIVFGEGNPDAMIMLVGEAPGAKEIEMKKPFVGQAGKNLDEFLEVLDLERKDIYITNVVKVRPYRINEKTGKKSNRPPNKKEVEQYEKYLFKEIAIVRPKIIVTLGNIPLKTVLKDKKVKIGDLHGTILQQEHFYIFPLYHPASIIYRQELKKIYMKDLHKLRKFLDRFDKN